MIKTNIKLQVIPEQSAKVQQICFDNGIYWSNNTSNIVHTDFNYLFISRDEICYGRSRSQFLLNSLEEVNAELFIATNGSCVELTNKFEEYGFEAPNFECKLYDKLDDFILGAYFNPNKQKWTMCRWGFDGRNKQGSHNYALTPILVHKPWYETCEYPAIVKDKSGNYHIVPDRNRDYNEDYLRSVTPLTDAEIETFKQGF